MVAVDEITPQPPAAAMVLVTVNVPPMLAVRLTTPVEVLTKLNPAGLDENNPATPPPLNKGDGFVPAVQ